MYLQSIRNNVIALLISFTFLQADAARADG